MRGFIETKLNRKATALPLVCARTFNRDTAPRGYLEIPMLGIVRNCLVTTAMMVGMASFAVVPTYALAADEVEVLEAEAELAEAEAELAEAELDVAEVELAEAELAEAEAELEVAEAELDEAEAEADEEE